MRTVELHHSVRDVLLSAVVVRLEENLACDGSILKPCPEHKTLAASAIESFEAKILGIHHDKLVA